MSASSYGSDATPPTSAPPGTDPAWTAPAGPGGEGPSIGVVIPAYRVARQIEAVVRGIPPFVTSIIVVDDKSPDDSAERVLALADPRVTLLRHAANGGVGAAMRTGFLEAIRQRLDIVVKMDGDGQMDPAHLPALLGPLLASQADMTKGNRYVSLDSMLRMPKLRILGNTGMSFLVKLASGYWRDFDPTNGYFAIRRHVLELMNLERLADDYFFESSLLVELGIRRAVIRSVPMPSIYGDEESSLSILRCAWSFPPRLFLALARRVLLHYYVRDFSPVSIFLLAGVPALLWGLAFGAWAWSEHSARGEPATAGIVMLAALPLFLGFELILQAIVLDVGNVPKTVLSPALQGQTPRLPRAGGQDPS
jgi:dolichol-phosphate mannosyltransferase